MVFGAAEFTVANGAIALASLVTATLTPNADHDADDLDGHSVFVQAGAGEMVGALNYDGPMVGDYSILYTVAAA